MPKTLQEYRDSLAALYDPQAALIRQQQAQLPGQEQAAISGADAALNLAYQGNTEAANRKGMVYSGNPIAENNKYAALTYAPEIARIKSNTLSQRSKLEQGLLGLEADRSSRAQDLYNSDLKAEQDAQYRAAQLAIQREKATRTTKPSATDRQAAFNQDLISAFNQVNGGQIKYRPFIREQVANQLAATYGIPIDQALKQVNSIFTDSWDAGMQVKGGYRKPGS